MQPTIQQRIDLTKAPDRLPCMMQTWQELAFVHWKVDPEAIQSKLPPGLTVDLHAGTAWLGLVPFQMRHIRPIGLPPLPWLSYFLELNLRTYVYDRYGRPGVWFFSLDCNQPVAVRVARRFFHLPYYDAAMREIRLEDGFTRYEFARHGCAPSSSFEYCLAEPLPSPAPPSLEHFLLERYLLFAWSDQRQQLYSGRVSHLPYPTCRLNLRRWTTEPIQQAGLPVPNAPPDHAIASHGVGVKVFCLEQEGKH